LAGGGDEWPQPARIAIAAAPNHLILKRFIGIGALRRAACQQTATARNWDVRRLFHYDAAAFETP
jgi:hypothetical protein